MLTLFEWQNILFLLCQSISPTKPSGLCLVPDETSPLFIKGSIKCYRWTSGTREHVLEQVNRKFMAWFIQSIPCPWEESSANMSLSDTRPRRFRKNRVYITIHVKSTTISRKIWGFGHNKFVNSVVTRDSVNTKNSCRVSICRPLFTNHNEGPKSPKVSGIFPSSLRSTDHRDIRTISSARQTGGKTSL